MTQFCWDRDTNTTPNSQFAFLTCSLAISTSWCFRISIIHQRSGAFYFLPLQLSAWLTISLGLVALVLTGSRMLQLLEPLLCMLHLHLHSLSILLLHVVVCAHMLYSSLALISILSQNYSSWLPHCHSTTLVYHHSSILILDSWTSSHLCLLGNEFTISYCSTSSWLFLFHISLTLSLHPYHFSLSSPTSSTPHFLPADNYLNRICQGPKPHDIDMLCYQLHPQHSTLFMYGI